MLRNVQLFIHKGHAIDPTAASWVQWQVWSCGIMRWTKRHWGTLSPIIWTSPAHSHSTDCSTFINHSLIDATVRIFSILTASLNNQLKKDTHNHISDMSIAEY
jgi:hypothetical protein